MQILHAQMFGNYEVTSMEKNKKEKIQLAKILEIIILEVVQSKELKYTLLSLPFRVSTYRETKGARAQWFINTKVMKSIENETSVKSNSTMLGPFIMWNEFFYSYQNCDMRL